MTRGHPRRSGSHRQSHRHRRHRRPGGFLFGYDSSVINGANKAVFYEFQITDKFMQGFVVAIALLGSALGAFIGGRLTDKYGRKKVMVVAAILFLIAGVGQAFPFSTLDFMLWRVVGGFAIGLAAVVSPMYISEVAPAHLRGRLSSLFQLAIVFGIFATQLINQVIIGLTRTRSKRPVEPGGASGRGQQPARSGPGRVAVDVPVHGRSRGHLLVLSLTLPESPRYLVARGSRRRPRRCSSRSTSKTSLRA